MVMIMIKLQKSFFVDIEKAARDGLPEEICGLLGGVIEGDVKIVKEIYFLENIDHSNEHFTMAPRDQFAAVKDMRAKGFVPLGNFHSHPESPSRPSEEDKRLAFDKCASYMIMSLMDRDNSVLKSFHIEGTESSEEELVLI